MRAITREGERRRESRAVSHEQEQTVTEAEAAQALRGVLAEVDDPDDELTASAATRHRIEGAALALEVISRRVG